MNQRGRPKHPDLFTPAEWRVVNLARHGLTNQQIADRLQVSINAVKYHIRNVLEKSQAWPAAVIINKQSLLQFVGAPQDSAFHRRTAMNQTAPIQSIGQIARTCTDVVKSEQFYKEQLGLIHLYTFDKMSFFDVDGVRLMLSETDSLISESIIYFQTDDIKTRYRQLKKQGIEFSHTPHKVHTHENGVEEWMAFFNDPDGRPLGLMGQIEP
ncbi:LuxR C-terminal-related transcriptional regulator [Marinicella meishanensis]|uniref:LuxR C-terminal-related transcriptional regulator n=1 Tax=Marinicella meishanensis TaxID=2873263 RepID=UPI001CBCB6B2|nr:LuxR C-terminal-related transcriptional regulator [Marinicella sp. NBU2979]